MAAPARPSSPVLASEEAIAAARLVLGLTLGVGAMAAAIGVSTGQLLAVVGLPTLVLVIAILRRSVGVAGWSAVAVWLCFLPPAHGEAIIAPLAMIVLCAAIAVGPDRLVSWIVEDVAGHHGGGTSPHAQGWIEEDRLPVD